VSLLSHLQEGVPELLSGAEIARTATYLSDLQRPNGMIPWFEAGHCDPWNHVEVAMALTVTGHHDAARAAYRWLATTQLGNGSWFNYYVGSRVKDQRLDTNVTAYLATGLYHYLLVTDDVDFVAELWGCVEAAIEFVLRWQLDDGTVRWSLDALGRPESYSLLTGSSSIFHSLRCAVALWPITRAPSRRRTSSRWTGTTRSFAGRCAERAPSADSTTAGNATSWRATGYVASLPTTG